MESLSSFGFRGEALNAICTSSDLTICTKTCTQDCGVQMVFDTQAKIKSQQQVPRKQGTTVCVNNLFHPFPVRQQELKRNAKREFAKCIHMIQSYALISDGIRFLCVHQHGKKSETVFQCTGKSMKDNVITLFSFKQFQTLTEVIDTNHDTIQFVVDLYLRLECMDLFQK